MDILFCSSWIYYYSSRGSICLLIVSSFVHCHGCTENIFKSLRIRLKSRNFFLFNIRTFVRKVPWHSVRIPPHKLENFLKADSYMLDNEISTSCRLFVCLFFNLIRHSHSSMHFIKTTTSFAGISAPEVLCIILTKISFFFFSKKSRSFRIISIGKIFYINSNIFVEKNLLLKKICI